MTLDVASGDLRSNIGDLESHFRDFRCHSGDFRCRTLGSLLGILETRKCFFGDT